MTYGATDSAAPGAQYRSGDLLPTNAGVRTSEEQLPNAEERTQGRVLQNLKSFYNKNFGLFLVFLAQTCGSVMNVSARLLTTGYEVKFHALQIIFIRMLCTTILGCLYMWYNKTPDFPLGKRGIRHLLILRGSAGFVGLFGLYYSLSWLSISDATVITFIIPTLTAVVCFIWLREPFTTKEALAGLIAFTGVLFVARPPWLFPSPPIDPITGQPEPDVSALSLYTADLPKGIAPVPRVSPAQRTLATLVAILGAFGASTAYSTIRVIGKRAHSLISVNYFAGIATLGSAIIILVHPDLHFVMPTHLSQWGLIGIIGLTGFLLQFLLTEGLQREKAGRATNLTYLQLVFALIIERIIWGTTPPMESFFGAALIISAAIWISLQRNVTVAEQQQKTKVADEESSLLGGGQASDP